MHLLCQLCEQAFAAKAHTQFPPQQQRNLKAKQHGIPARTMTCAHVIGEHIFH